MDLIIRNARLADRSSAELSDIGVGNGRIVAIERRLAADAEVYDAEGRTRVDVSPNRPFSRSGLQVGFSLDGF